jgi:hypothetical protein
MAARGGGSGRLPLSPKFSAYFAFAESTSSRILAIAFTSCSKVSALEGIRKLNAVPSHLPLVALSSAAEPPHERPGSALPLKPVPS